METKTRINNRLEVTRGIKDGKAGIDRQYQDELGKYRGVIKGVAIMTKGNVKDFRGWGIDDATLDQVVAAGGQANVGLKSRFGHPNMSTEALGTFLGRAKNFYRDGNTARADLYLSQTAYDTPSGDLASYVLNLAEKDPAAFGTSVVLGDFDLEYLIEKDGSPKKDAQGDELPPVLRIGSLLAVDAVDDPAANDSMFGSFFSDSVQLSAQATNLLDKFLDNPDAVERVMAFLEKYRVNRVDIEQEKINGLKTKEVVMSLGDLTIEQLKKDRPDLVSVLQSEAVKEERSRCSSIVKSANKEFVGMGMEAVVEDAVDNGKSVDAALAAMRGKRLEDLKKAANIAPGADGEEQAGEQLSHVDRAKKYKAQRESNGFACGMTEALRATAPQRKKK